MNTRVELAQAGAVLRDRINEQHMLAGVTIVDPATHLDRPHRRARSRRDAAPVHDPPRRDDACRRSRDPRQHRRDRRPHRAARERRDRSVTFAPERSSATPPRRAPTWRSRTLGSATGRRSRTCRTSATPTSARTRTSAPVRSPPTSRTSPASRRSAPRSGATSGPRSTMVSSRPSRWGTEHGSLPDRSSQRTCRPDALGIARARQENKEGYAARQRGD